MLFFINKTPTLFQEISFSDGTELASVFMNFIQFHIIEGMNGSIICQPLTMLKNFNRVYYEQQFRHYKSWYLNYIVPKEQFNWLGKCDNEQLDNLIKNLEEKGFIILRNVFFPLSKEDKISLIIASINSILPLEKSSLEKIFEDEETLFELPRREYEVNEYHDYLIFRENFFQLAYDTEKYEGIGLPLNNCEKYIKGSNTYHHTVYSHKYSLILVGKIGTKVIDFRLYHLNLINESTRQKKHRENKQISDEELTVKIYKKNMPLLKKLTHARKITPSKYINELIEDTYKIRFSDD